MTELVDDSIAELRAIHDRLTAQVAGLSADQLTAQSGAEDWTVADVLSHLGSGAEIGRYPVVAAAGAPEDAPGNQEVWDRWNALPPADQAAAFVASEERLVATYEAFSPEQRDSAQVDFGFLPNPVPLATALGMRLNEMALHGWDVEAGLDPSAALSDRSAELIARHHAETMSFLFGFRGKPEGIGPARVGIGGYTIVITDGLGFEAGEDDTTATFDGPLEAAIRLMAGRLKPEYTPAGVGVTGDMTLDELRKAFPGY